MPTFQSQTFSCLIAEHLASFKLGLVAQCEALAKEQQQSLNEEIEQLRQENAKLRSRLPADSSSIELKLVQEPPALGPKPSAQGDKLLALSDADANAPEGAASREKPAPLPNLLAQDESSLVIVEADTGSMKGPFHLLPDLLADPWSGGDEIDTHHGAFLERTADDPILISRFILDPGSNTKLAWDILGIPILAWDLITIPLQVFVLGEMGDDVMAAAGWVTLIYWTVDMPVTFRTGFFDEDANLVVDVKRIARNYLHGFLWLDGMIITADWLTVLIDAIGNDAPGFLANLPVLRALRISRFVRLLRLKKLKQKIQTVEDSINSEWTLVILNLLAKVCSIVVVNHYIACVWYALGNAESIESAPYRWLTSHWFPQYDYREEGNKKLSDAAWHYQYLTSLHWAIAQFTPGPQNIQPQNSFERVYVIVVLLFGMIVFSSFIASVTQARMQLNKMMSKFERDNWLLRKYCRQHKVSRHLQTHMRRYVDFVIIPNYHKLTPSDVVLLPKLSAHLRAELCTELQAQHLCVHPFFKKLGEVNASATNYVCNHTIETCSFARADVAFTGGAIGRCMLFVTSGMLDYIPIYKNQEEVRVHPRHWCSEAVLWTHWTHQGQLQASIETTAIQIQAAKFRTGMQDNGFVMALVRAYGLSFCANLSKLWAKQGMPTDLHEEAAWGVDLDSLTGNTFGWLGGALGKGTSSTSLGKGTKNTRSTP